MKLTIELDDYVAKALDERAVAYGVTREELVGSLLGSIAEGLRRPGSWEAEHVEALLGPLELARQ